MKGKDQWLCDPLRLNFLFPTANYWHHLNTKEMFPTFYPPWLKEKPRDMKVAQTSSNKKPYNGMCEYQPGGDAAESVSIKLIGTPGPLTGYSSIPAPHSFSGNAKTHHGDLAGPRHSRCCLPVSFALAAEKKNQSGNCVIHMVIINIHTPWQPLFQLIWSFYCWSGSLLYARSRSEHPQRHWKKILSLSTVRILVFKHQVDCLQPEPHL